MKRINRMMTNICSNCLSECKEFYTQLFDFKVDFDSDWFVHLISNDKNIELGIIDRTNEMVPKDFQNSPQGVYLTFVVDSVEEVFKLAKANNIKIISEPVDMFYGQRRLLLEDPNGTLVDVSSPIDGFKF